MVIQDQLSGCECADGQNSGYSVIIKESIIGHKLTRDQLSRLECMDGQYSGYLVVSQERMK